ncbi:MAG: hypothetical protein D6731_15295, partial [Planctomycetota bacterium]
MSVERRRHVRRVLSGDVQITSVTGSTTVPPGPGRVIDCSRGGALLRLPNPRPRLFGKPEPCLRPPDVVTCTLRLPPTFQDVEVFAEVVRVSWAGDGDGSLDVGVRFFYDAQRRSHTDKSMQCLVAALGPECWSSASRPALPLQPQGSEERARQAKQTSARQAKQTSARQAKQTSARRAKQTSARQARQTSARQAKQTSARQAKQTSARQAKQTS